MIVDCPSCGTRFRLDESALGEAGRRLRCSVCHHVWFRAPPEAAGGEAEAPHRATQNAAGRDGGERGGASAATASVPRPMPTAERLRVHDMAVHGAMPSAAPRQGSGGWGFILLLLLVIGGLALAVMYGHLLPPFWA